MSAATAAGIAAAVRAGAQPVDAVRVALDRIAVLDGDLGAFATVRREAALTEAALLAGREDLDRLPLAGVPVAVRTRFRCTASRPGASRRLRRRRTTRSSYGCVRPVRSW